MKHKTVILFFMISSLLVVPLLAGSVQAKPKGKLVIAYANLGNEATDTVRTISRNEESILESLGDGLTVMQWKGANPYFKPGIASSWTISPDLMTFTLKLRKGVKFHDGTLVTMEDVLHTHYRAINSPLTKATSYKGVFKSIEAKGDDTVIFKTKKPDPFFLMWPAHYAIHPKKYIEKIGEKAFTDKPIYAGPWKFVKHVQGDYVELEAFEDHWRKAPYAKTLILKAVPEAATQLAMIRAGEADLLYYAQAGPTLKEMEKDSNIKVHQEPGFSGWYAVFTHLSRTDMPDTVFRDKRVRQALSYAIDRQLIIDKILYGYGEPMSTCCIPVGTPQWHQDAQVPNDVEKAKALLKEAGFGKGLKVKAFTTAREKVITEAVASMWKRIGVETEIIMYETGTIGQAYRKRTLPDGIRFSRHWISPLGMQAYFLKTRTYTNMVDEKLDELTQKMLTHEMGPEMLAFVKNNMTQYVYDLVPCIELIAPPVIHAYRKDLGVDEWLKWGTREWSYGPCAEYLKPRR